MHKYFPVIALFILVFAAACHREGTGGTYDFDVFPKHDTTHLSYTTLYVRYGAKDLPGTNPSDYDMKVNGDSTDHLLVKNLRKGNYFLYSVGFDSLTNTAVSGGVHVSVTEKSGTKKVDIAVKE